MAFSCAAGKRKAEDEDEEIQYEPEEITYEYDSECVNVARPPQKRLRVASQPPQKRPRVARPAPKTPLLETDAAQAHNKTRRTLKSVTIYTTPGDIHSYDTVDYDIPVAPTPKHISGSRTDGPLFDVFSNTRSKAAAPPVKPKVAKSVQASSTPRVGRGLHTKGARGLASEKSKTSGDKTVSQAPKQFSMLKFFTGPASDDVSGEPTARSSIANTSDEASASQRRTRKVNRRSYAEVLEDSDEDLVQVRRGAILADSDFEEEDDASPVGDVSEDESGRLDGSSSMLTEATDEEAAQAKWSKSRARGKLPMAKSGLPAVDNAKVTKASKEDMLRLLNRPDKSKGLAAELPPLSNIDDIFRDITKKAIGLGIGKALRHLQSRPVRIATMCSGTESPLLALQLVHDMLEELGLGALNVEHVFSAEIVPYKQAYIERNFAPPIIFRDITEFIQAFQSDIPTATTAYGSRIVVPTEVDIVIAGTSCVDYSAMNNKKKNLSEDGESGMTWKGALAYCRACRPAIIIFENVIKAEWGTMLEHYRDIDYDCKSVLVDSKDYYIPHTRQRGYMVCFDTLRSTSVNGKAPRVNDRATRWQALMQDFQRYASSPVSSFLIPNDQVTVRQSTRDDEATKEVDWTQCEITQMQYRQEKKLGNARPFTQWQESGSVVPPENGSAPWYYKQVERVLDTIDCNILRKALPDNGMYDVRYKTRIWDLSQNIYRFTDHSAFGITGCITPSGQFFVSDIGRVLAPEETLKLQGIPLNKISLTTETAAEIQDLAGNAMTSTVVGASLLAALICGHELIETKVEVKGAHTIAPTMQPLLSGRMEQSCTLQPDARDLDLTIMLRDAEKAARRCYCEGSYSVCDKPIQECEDCGHTTCTSCGGSPPHNYRLRLLDVARMPPSEFEQSLRSHLPLRLSLSSIVGAGFASDASCEGLVQGYVEALETAVASHYNFVRIRRTHCWTISYAAEQARLDLVIEDAHAEWRLYALADKALNQEDELRLCLDEPIAKAVVTSALFDPNTKWLWRRPCKRMTIAKVTPRGTLARTWWARNAMPGFESHVQPDRLQVEVSDDETDRTARSISGTYKYLPKCGKAADSLYQRTGEGRPVYLFLDPTRTGGPANDQMVFSHNIARLEYDEVRSTIARVKASWRPWPTDPRKATTAGDVVVYSVWQPFESSLQIVETALETCHSTRDPVQLDNATCHTALTLVSCNFEADGSNEKATNLAYDTRFLSDQAWVFEAIRRQLSSEWQKVESDEMHANCEQCAPIKPLTRWKLIGDKKTIVPYEDPESAATYERAVKSRPMPLVVQLTAQDDRQTCQFGISIASLSHRVLARLSHSTDIQGAAVQWKIDACNTESITAFPKFRLQATKGLTPYKNKLAMSVDLFPKQQLSLAWMRSQECEGSVFDVEEAVEATLPVHGWRVEVRASKPVRIRGGICADHPGFGKTITSLALIQAQLQDQTRAQIKTELRARSADLLVSTATVIVCPTSLTTQWSDEIKDKLCDPKNVLVIRTPAELSKYTFADFENATIILVSRAVLTHEAYTERLAAFAAMPGPGSSSRRAFAHWRQIAIQAVPEHLRIFQEESISALRQHIRTTYAQRMKSDDFKAAVPSKRLRGKDYVPGKGSKLATHASGASTTINVDHLHKPLFEMFYFNRIIIDEFHQQTADESAAISSLQADKRWGLSATPAMSDFYDIAKMAGILKLPLRIGADSRGIMKAKNISDLRKDMTAFELFDAMREVPSASLHARIHEIDQFFLDTFVRRNIMDFAELKYVDHLVPVRLNLDHRAMYTELSQHLNSSDMRIRKGKKSSATDRQDRLHAVINTSSTAEEALSKSATFADAGAGLSAVISTRKREVRDLLQDLAQAIALARNNESDQFSSWTSTRLRDKTLGDGEAISEIEVLMGDRSSKKSVTSKARRNASDDGSGNESAEAGKSSKSGKNARVSAMNDLCKRLVTVKRSLRYLDGVRKIQENASSPSEASQSLCNNADCHSMSHGRGEFGVSAFCGHTVCHDCYRHMQEEHHGLQCPAFGCTSPMEQHHLLWTSKMGELQRTHQSPYGAKIDAALNILEEIQAKGDQAILFVQFAQQLVEVKTALKDRDITAIVVKDLRLAADQLEEFRTNARHTVVVLDSSDETAAGSNLQNANHVIFLSPLLKVDQYEYESTMAQAIGRVKRHGQKKEIHVYRIVALDTIDVDILEHRERRLDALVEVDASPITPPKAAQTLSMHGEPRPERTQLVVEKGQYSLRPQSWLVQCGADDDGEEMAKVKGKKRVLGWDDFSSLVKFSKGFSENDD